MRYYSELDGVWQETRLPFPSPSQGHLHATDFDGDGDADFLLARGPLLATYLNAGGADFGDAARPLAYSAGQVTGMYLGDVNADGYDDVIYAHNYVPSPLDVRYVMALNARGQGLIRVDSLTLDFVFSRYLGDVNGDDAEEFIVLSGTQLHLYPISRGGRFGSPRMIPSTAWGGSLLDATAFDLDVDGEIELLGLVRVSTTLAIRALRLGPNYEPSVAWTAVVDSLAFESKSHRIQPVDLSGAGAFRLLLTVVDDSGADRYLLKRDAGQMVIEASDRTSLEGHGAFFPTTSGGLARVNLFEPQGDQVVFAETRSANAGAAPARPAGLSASVPDPGTVVLSWISPPDERFHYHVELRNPEIGYRTSTRREPRGEQVAQPSAAWNDYALGARTRTERIFTDLAAGGYIATVRSVDSSGRESEASLPVVFWIGSGPSPAAPSLTVTPGDGGLVLTWRHVALADSVVIERRVPGWQFRRLTASPPGRDRYVDREIEPGATYDYRAFAFLAGASSQASVMVGGVAPASIVQAIELPDPTYRVRRLARHDLDGDGEPDLIVIAVKIAEFRYRVWMIPGSLDGGMPAAFRHILDLEGGLHNFHLADLDGDHQTDFIATTSVSDNGAVVALRVRAWMLEAGSLSVRSTEEIELSPDVYGLYPNVLRVTDVDRDGLADLIIAPSQSSELFVRWGSLGGPPVAPQLITGSAFRSYLTAVVDFDQDGYPDVIVPGPDNRLRAFLGGADRLFEERSVWSAPPLTVTEYAPFWFDDDTRPDLLVNGDSGWRIFALDSDIDAYTNTGLALTGSGEARPVHLDADGDVDFAQVLRSMPSAIRLWLNDADSLLTWTQLSLTDSGGRGDLVMHDIDADGSLDVVYSTADVAGQPGDLYALPAVAGVPPPLSKPTGLTATGQDGALALDWTAPAGWWGRPGHLGYGVVVASEADTLVVGGVTPWAGSPRDSADPAGLHATSVRIGGLAPGTYSVRVGAYDMAGRYSGLTSPVAAVVGGVAMDPGSEPGGDNELAGPVPNPAGASTVMLLILARPRTLVSIQLVDALGRVVATLHEGAMEAGRHELRIRAGALAPGVYLVHVNGERLRLTRRLVVLR